MDWNLGKTLTAAISSLVAFTSVIGAAEDTQIRNLENRVSALEQRRGSNCVINPPARCWDCEVANLYLEGSVFVWQATESGMEFALRNPANLVNTETNARYKKLDFDWDWGFKIAAGYLMPHDGWDLFLQWTRFHPDRTHRSTSVSGSATTNGNLITPLLSPDSQLGNATGATASWKLRLDLIDLELGREFYTSRWLTLRPFVGLRSAWIHQRTKATYDNTAVLTSMAGPIPTTVNANVNLKNNYWGLGLRMGLDTEWGIGGGFNLFGEMAGSLLLGHFSIAESESAWNLATGALISGGSATFSEQFRATRFMYDLAMGLRYRQSFCCERYMFMAQLGWEQHMFVNQNQIQKLFPTSTHGRSIYVTNQGDLSTQGVTLTVEFGF